VVRVGVVRGGTGGVAIILAVEMGCFSLGSLTAGHLASETSGAQWLVTNVGNVLGWLSLRAT
jgi:hypothetical protein